jgi:hypothetical protein
MALCRQNIEAKEVIGKIFWNKDLAGLVGLCTKSDVCT